MPLTATTQRSKTATVTTTTTRTTMAITTNVFSLNYSFNAKNDIEPKVYIAVRA